MAEKSVVVLGGGIGGVVAARLLRRRLRDGRIALVDRSLSYRFQPSLLWLMSGARRRDQITADLGRLRRAGIDVIETEALEIDTHARTVKTIGPAIPYDRVVVAPGAELAPEALPGFVDAAHNLYTVEGAEAAGRALREFAGERIAVVVSRLPYKCPAAPYEAAMLAESIIRRRGIRDRVSIDVFTPEPFPMPTAGPEIGEALEAMLAGRGIGFHPEATVEGIDAAGRELVLAGGERAGFDLLLGIPPHRAPELLARSGLTANGFVPVDRATLATAAEGAYAIGDATAIPIAGGKFLPKAGVFAHGQAKVVAERIADELAGRTPTASFVGMGSCFVEMGDGIAAYATGNFYAEEAPDVRLHSPGRRWHIAKVAFEKYWLRRWY
ncbi:MAG: FAD/NAD(P)-binding oxidoreductase [Actinomycetota bacterium]